MQAQIQVFTLPKSQDGRKALRFFSERRVPVHSVDLRRRAPSPGELRRFVQRFGVDGVLDAAAPVVVERGLRYLGGSDEDWIARMADEPRMLRLPLVRCGSDLAVGHDPDGWQRMVDSLRD